MTPPDAEITELPSSPGARLRREREARGMSEQQAAEALNLDPAVLASLEANDFNALGAPVFVKGHLRRYATLLGLSEDELLASYERSKQHVDEPTLVPKSRLEMLPARNRPRWPLIVGGAVAFLLAAAGVAYLSEHGLPWQQQPAAETTEAAEPADVQASQAAPAATPEPAPDSSLPQAEQDAATSARTDAGAPPAFTSGSAATDAAATGVAASAATGPATSPATPPAAPLPGQVSLQLRFAADSWVEVFDGSGKAVVFELGKAGTERSLTATAPLSVTLGNGPGVTVSINGRTQPAPAAGGQALVRFSVAPDGSVR
jgi:cytoskeleton protein RodZ